MQKQRALTISYRHLNLIDVNLISVSKILWKLYTHKEIFLKLKNCGLLCISIFRLVQLRSRYLSNIPRACTVWVWLKSITVRRKTARSSSVQLWGSRGREREYMRRLHASKPLLEKVSHSTYNWKTAWIAMLFSIFDCQIFIEHEQSEKPKLKSMASFIEICP